MVRDRPASLIVACLIVLAAFAGWLVGIDPRQEALLRNTLLLVGGTCAISVPLGTLIAFLLVRSDLPGRRQLAAVLGAMLFVPLYLQAAGWDAGFGKLGWFPASGDQMMPLLSGWRAAVWIHAMASMPWVVLIVAAGIRQVEPELEEEMLLVAPWWRVALAVTLPRTLAAIAVAALWVAVLTAGEMTVTDQYLVRTFAEELYTGFALGDDLGSSWLTVLPGIAAQACLILIGLLIARNAARATRTSVRPPRVFQLRWMRVPVTMFVTAVLAMIVGLPLGNLFHAAGIIVRQTAEGPIREWSLVQTLHVVLAAPVRYVHEFRWTAEIAAMAATAAVLIALPLAWTARRGGYRAWPAMLIGGTLISLPGPLIGLLVIGLLDRAQPSIFIWLYDRTLLAPVLAVLCRVLPIATLICWYALRSIADDVLDSAACEGAGPVAQFWRIALPQRWLALGAAWLVCFAIGAGDLACSILVVPPGVITVPIRVFGLLHYGVDEQVAAICLAVVLMYGVLAGAVTCIFRFGDR
jgi:iron(III) transport system permease protein